MRSLRRLALFSLVSAALASAAAFDYNKLYTLKTTPILHSVGKLDTAFIFAAAAVGGKYARTNVPIRDGGASDLFRDPSDPTGLTFWSVNDRGMNTDYQPASQDYKMFPFPGYHQKLMKLHIVGDSIEMLSMDSIRGLDTGYTVGLVSSKAPTDEIALQMRLDSAVADSSRKLARTPNGYDFEGITKDNAGHFYLSDEYGPFIVRVDSATKKIDREWYPGHRLPTVLARRRVNRGLEALCITPSGYLVGMMQSGLYNTVSGKKSAPKDSSRVLRMVWFNPADSSAKEFVYLMDRKGGTRKLGDTKVGAITSVNDSTFLVTEHGADASSKYWMDIYKVTITAGATNVTKAVDPDSLGTLYNGGTQTLEQLGYIPNDSANLAAAGVVPVKKSLYFGDVMARTPWTHQKPEGLSIINDSTLAIINDNDYGMTDNSADGIPHLLPDIATHIMYFKVNTASAPAGVRAAPAGRPSFSVAADRGGWRVQGTGAFEVSLSDAQGRELFRSASSQGSAFVSRAQSGGVYWLTIRTNGVRDSRRVVQW